MLPDVFSRLRGRRPLGLAVLALVVLASGCVGERPELIVGEGPGPSSTAAPATPPPTVAPTIEQCATAVGAAPFRVQIQPGQPVVPCVRVAGFQRLEVINPTPEPVSFNLGASQYTVDAGGTLVTEPLGAVLAPGFNDPAALPHPLTAPWLLEPQEGGLTGATMKLTAIGSVQLGMTVDDVVQATGVGLTSDGLAGCELAGLAGDPSSPVFTLRDQRVTVIQVFTGGNQTPSAVGVGSTEDEIVATYGERLETQPSADGDPNKKMLVFVPTDEFDKQYRLVFEVEGGVVTSIRTGLIGFVMDSAGCETG